MKQLTPLGYLKPYVHYLSYCRSMSLKKLAVEAGTDNWRLKAPFMLYILFSDKQDKLLKFLQSDEYRARREDVIKRREEEWGHLERIVRHLKEFDFYQYCSDFFSKYNKDNIVAVLEDPNRPLDVDADETSFYYHKCWDSYVCERNMPNVKKRTAKLARERVREYQEKYGITNSQIYKELKLNPGNVNAWLNYNKQIIGKNSALKIVDYCRKFELEVNSDE